VSDWWALLNLRLANAKKVPHEIRCYYQLIGAGLHRLSRKFA
jgi:hypothetical protein